MILLYVGPKGPLPAGRKRARRAIMAFLGVHSQYMRLAIALGLEGGWALVALEGALRRVALLHVLLQVATPRSCILASITAQRLAVAVLADPVSL